MEHDGKALAADETDSHLRRKPGVASVHVRAALTWCAIFPMVALGMTVLGWFAEGWHPVLRALVLTLVVVPTAVYVLVPQLLRLHARLGGAARERRHRSLKARSERASNLDATVS